MKSLQKSRLSHYKQARLSGHFISGSTARTSASLCGVKRKVIPDSIVYSDCWRGDNVLDVSDFHHFRITHSRRFADRHNHINGIENFWNQAKRHMRKFNGVPKVQFGLYLKECEGAF